MTAIIIFLIIFLGIIAFCIAGGLALRTLEADIREKLQKKLNEEKSEGMKNEMSISLSGFVKIYYTNN